MPIDTGGTFMGRLGQQMPGMLNATAQQYGDPRLRNTNRQVGNAYGSFQRRPKAAVTNPEVQGQQTTMQNGPHGMPPTGPSPLANAGAGGMMPETDGIVRGPSMPRVMPGGMPFQGGGFMPPGRNTGITGGMFGPGGPVLRPQVEPQMGMGPQMGGGLWQMYNQLSQEQGVPRRPQMFY